MAIDKKKNIKNSPFRLDEADNFQPENHLQASNPSEDKGENVGITTSASVEQPKKRGRKIGSKLAKSYKFQLVPGAIETQLLISIPVDLHEKIKESAQKIGETVKEYVSKHLADLVDFEYKKGVLVLSEDDAVASVAKYPWTWDSLSEEYKTILVFQTLINTNPRWFMNCKDLNKELLVSITKEQWVKIVLADYNAIKSVPAEYLNFVLKSIKENLNNNNDGENNSDK